MKNLVLIIGLLLGSVMFSYAQTSVSGTVTDAETGEGIPGVNIKVEGTVKGTITDPSGNFSMMVNTPPPFNLVFSYVGYTSETASVSGPETGLNISLSEETNLGKTVVVSASRVEESVMESPVTVEKLDLIAIQQSTAPSFYDQLNHVKGVNSTQASMTFNSINTRGFATQANVRFVQLIDGVDNAAPLLNFPAGNIVGISELDVESVELVPGAASALYGPNAFNGILMMNSKSPFEYQGLSATAKIGFNSSNAQGTDGPFESNAYGTEPYYEAAIRYAKSFANDRLAFKVNFSYMESQDWRANEYNTQRETVSTFGNPNNVMPGDPNFDGVNLYGDETEIPFDLGLFGAPFNTLSDENRIIRFNRTGFTEEMLADNFDASSIKGDAALHWRINDQLELSYAYRYGTGDGVYQGAQRYALRNFVYQSHKLELKGNNFFVRAYTTGTDAGDSYNLDALGAFINERIHPSVITANSGIPTFNPLDPTTQGWAPTYAAVYGQTLATLQPGIFAGQTPTAVNAATAHAAARSFANGISLVPGVSLNDINSPAFQNFIEQVRSDKFKRNPPNGPGGSFVDDSKLYHAEFNYNFRDLVDFIEIQVGGNFRRYDLFSDNTVFNEVNENGENERITIDEFGGYIQLMKRLVEDRLKITASLRYDKNENFDGQVTPRISAVFTAGADRQHNIRASFQTGFRNPDTQAQFIFFPSSAGTLLGSTEANAGPYGIHNGGAFTHPTGDPRRQPINIPYVQPERLTAFEIGYKGIINDNFLIDFNVYRNAYQDFIAGQTVYAANAVTGLPTGDVAPDDAFRPSVNSDVDITSIGVGVGLTYNLPSNFVLSGTYNYADFDADLEEGSTFEVGFNTPNNRFTLGLANREVFENFGFAINYRWQEEFRWESSFAHGTIPAYGVLDAQVNYKVPDIKTVFKIGATNLLQEEFRTNAGGSWIGSMYYISVTFDQFLRR